MSEDKEGYVFNGKYEGRYEISDVITYLSHTWIPSLSLLLALLARDPQINTRSRTLNGNHYLKGYHTLGYLVCLHCLPCWQEIPRSILSLGPSMVIIT